MLCSLLLRRSEAAVLVLGGGCSTSTVVRCERSGLVRAASSNQTSRQQWVKLSDGGPGPGRAMYSHKIPSLAGVGTREPNVCYKGARKRRKAVDKEAREGRATGRGCRQGYIVRVGCRIEFSCSSPGGGSSGGIGLRGSQWRGERYAMQAAAERNRKKKERESGCRNTTVRCASQ
ncbi:hypothetical protein BDZ91DRAFT_236389 [Kalaharituber pfeilii]|nr:hypothetical protein BDZ91DRAFT_236389 [Kalaharituber pfeilii]